MAVLTWLDEIDRSSACPVCTSNCEKRKILNISHYGDHTEQYWEPIDLILCPNCEARFYQPPISIEHENVKLVKFYIEQGGGISAMLLPFLMIDDRPIENYLEIGCGFGFSLDYARQMLGWTIRGYDPSATAERGKELLDLPISTTYFDESSAEIGSMDLILCSEVIEHVADPVAYIRLARMALKPEGLLLLTTPNANSVVPGMAPELMPILSPGGHLVLFGPKTIHGLLQENGFSHIRLVEDGDQIRVAASMIPFGGPSDYYSRDRYFRYLEDAASRHAHSSPLLVGFLGRLFKEFVNAGYYDRADEIYEKLRQHILEEYGFDTDSPEGLRFPAPGTITLIGFGKEWPFNLCGTWYCRGIWLLLVERNYAGAAALFDAACRFGQSMRGTLQAFGADDGETAHLCREAELNRLGALAQCDVPAAVAAFEVATTNRFGLDPAMLADHLALARRRLFVDLVNLGHFAAAASLGIVAPGEDDWRMLRASAMVALLHHREPAFAAECFGRAFTAAGAEGAGATAAEAAWIKHHEVLARLVAADGIAAAEAARDLIGPVAGDWVPAEARAEIEALLAEHPAVLKMVLEG